MEKQLTIYTTPSCVYCLSVKEYLRDKGLPYNEKDVSEDHEALEEMIELSGQQGVPVIMIDGDVVIGYNRMMLDALLTDN